MTSEEVSFDQADYCALIQFQDRRSGESFCVSLGTLLQCLCIAEQLYAVPPFERDWELATIPSALREMSAIPSQ